MTFKELQKSIHSFSEERGWNTKKTNLVYNMIGNLSEETGEMWNIIKWVNNDEDLAEVISKNQADLKDAIGDLAWIVARLANVFGVDTTEALHATLDEYIGRFPVEKVKGKKANPTLGGFDGKYSK